MWLKEYFPIWNKLTTTELRVLENSAVKRMAPKGTFFHNDSADCLGLLIVTSGQLRAFIHSDYGKEITIYRLFERDICLFSASCIMSGIQFDITIEVEKDSEYWIIPSDVYHKLMKNSAVVANYTNQIMASRFSEIMLLLNKVMFNNFDSRLAAFLLQEGVNNDSDLLNITHEKIANHIGSAREVVSRRLKYFQLEGMVELTRGNIKLIDYKKLELLAQ